HRRSCLAFRVRLQVSGPCTPYRTLGLWTLVLMVRCERETPSSFDCASPALWVFDSHERARNAKPLPPGRAGAPGPSLCSFLHSFAACRLALQAKSLLER